MAQGLAVKVALSLFFNGGGEAEKIQLYAADGTRLCFSADEVRAGVLDRVLKKMAARAEEGGRELVLKEGPYGLEGMKAILGFHL